MEASVTIPDDLTLTVDNKTVTVEGEHGDVTRSFDHPQVNLNHGGDTVTFTTDSTRKEHRAVVNTYKSHLENMVNGVQNPYQYRLKAVYAHFPMQVSVKNGEFTVENFLGERAPRTLTVPETVDVSVDGDDITVTGPSKEAVGQFAADIERLCYMNKKDQRTFQDGIYLVERSTQDTGENT